MISEVFLGLGSNLDDPPSNIYEALRLLGRDALDLKASSLYRTSPQGFSSQPTFYNAACSLRTRLDPFQLMSRVLEIEEEVGRKRTFKNAPRVLDVDILIYGTMAFTSPILTVPHPLMAQRSFVLWPLAEIAPLAIHPVLHKTIRSLLEGLPKGNESVAKLPMRDYPTLNS